MGVVDEISAGGVITILMSLTPCTISPLLGYLVSLFCLRLCLVVFLHLNNSIGFKRGVRYCVHASLYMHVWLYMCMRTVFMISCQEVVWTFPTLTTYLTDEVAG
jgi:hypothetical protein